MCCFAIAPNWTRQLDLKTRLFTYPCSFLVHSASFDQLPDAVRSYVIGRMIEVLSDEDQSDDFLHIRRNMGREILEILADTKPEFRTRLEAMQP